ncbi:MAG: DUF4843 domain-containing protein [Bacteroidaceae bacterium]|nr:DUF4843 domain-containing protein [Bacteroidaceae bacterium]
MKRKNQYTAWLLALAIAFTACDTIEPDFFDENYNGAYFDYQNASDYETTLNFAEYIVGNPQVKNVALNIKLLGYLTDETRNLSIKTKSVEGYELAKVTIPDVTFGNEEYQKEIEVIVERPEAEDITYAVCIYLDGEGDLGTGIAGKNEYTIYVKESHEKPTIWDGQIPKYLGNWKRETHAFLANLTNNDYYYNDFKVTENVLNWAFIENLNILAVNSILAEDSQDHIAINIPILDPEDLTYNTAGYNKPYFWDKYKEYLGFYSSSRFYKFTRLVNNANTENIAQAYENAGEMMEKYKTDFNKEDVLRMLNEYYTYPKLGYTIDQYKEHLWVKVYKNIDYINKGIYLRIPYWWEDPDNLGTAEVVKRYFGEYDDKKYQFMLKTIIDLDGGADNFNPASILPFTFDAENNSYGWDETVGGEERLKECYRAIKKANDSKPEFLRVDIPDVKLD